ncbi:hypothetical protein TI39_contig4114g00013 [Zymoseptoria brevis]|uniref:CBM-cenC domain-containing protein n=1 Tax=Zymoseptoria brevis TaxID=1047168 RepID=A0A0F4GDJ3_9PEZI|nr:hypothetical protein TI39_contig4114g00013 [Zymoseptoria brevis]
MRSELQEPVEQTSTSAASGSSTTTAGPVVTCAAIANGGFEAIADDKVNDEDVQTDTWVVDGPHAFFQSNDNGVRQTPFGKKFASIGVFNDGGETSVLSQFLTGITPAVPYTLTFSYLAEYLGEYTSTCTLALTYGGQFIDRISTGPSQAEWATRTLSVSLIDESDSLYVGVRCDESASGTGGVVVLVDNFSLVAQSPGCGGNSVTTSSVSVTGTSSTSSYSEISATQETSQRRSKAVPHPPWR